MSANQQPWPGAVDTRRASLDHAGEMARWLPIDATHGGFAHSGTGEQRRIYVPLATTTTAGAQSAADKALLNLLADPPRCELTRTTNQSIANGTITAIGWNSAYVNAAGAAGAALWSAGTPTRLTAPVAGFYLITASLAWASGAGNIRHAWLSAGGGIFHFARSEMAPTAGGNTTHQVVAGLVQLAAAGYIELFGYQDSGGALNVVTSTALPYLAMKWVSPA